MNERHEDADGVAPAEGMSSTDAAWVKRIRETAADLRDNSLRLAKYPDMGEEARARELAALYIQEIADLHEMQARLVEAAETVIAGVAVPDGAKNG